MSEKELYTLLQELEIPVAYDRFKEVQNPPFMAYSMIPADVFNAENKTYYKSNNFQIEVVTLKHDVELLHQIEDLFDSHNIPYTTDDEVWDEDEKIYHNYYLI